MDQDFITELDEALSNVGSDVVWKKNVGGVEIWISPLQLVGQEKVADIITKMDLGANIVSESKRTTLSHSIVGIGEHDLRQYRGGSAVFPVPGKDGKIVKSTLDRYLYHKLGTWGAQFVDDVFLVYADLMETFQKNNLKDIKFENAKDLREELADLQVRVFEIRQQLNMPQLVEGSDTDTQDQNKEDQDREDREDQEDQESQDENRPESDSQSSFDPFTVMPRSQHVVTSPRQVPAEPPIPSGAAAQRARESAEIESFPSNGSAPVSAPVPVSVPEVQAAPQPSIRQDVVDRPASKEPIPPPVIDKMNVSVNPRFRPPGRV